MTDTKADFSVEKDGYIEIDRAQDMAEMLMVYNCAIKEVSTKLQILNDELQLRSRRNPIEFIKTRVKNPKSIIEKLRRRGFEPTVENAAAQLTDIAGIRVICSFIDDIYAVADMLINQDDVRLMRQKDYIKNPKPNGYRSLHLVVEIPVFFSDRKQPVPVEVQIRTIAMDFWASLEHDLHYKKGDNAPREIVEELKTCSDIIADTDMRMQNIHYQLRHYSSAAAKARGEEKG